MKTYILIPLLVAGAVLLPGNALAQRQITWRAVDASGAGSARQTASILYTSTGQPATGVSRSATRILHSGYLFARLVPIGEATIVTQPALDFGSVILGESRQQTLTVQNTGSQPLIISATTISPSVFSIAVGGGPQTIAPGGAIAIGIRFEPATAGPVEGTFTIASNASNDASFDVRLKGAGVASGPAISLSTTTLDFGTVTLGAFSMRSVTIGNTGNVALQVTGQTISGMHAADFTITHSCATAIQPGLNDYAQIRFSPSAEGVRTATLAIASSDPNTPSLGVQLSGSGASTARPRITLSRSIVDFGQVALYASKEEEIGILNSGTSDLVISSQEIAGTDALHFSIVQAAGSPVAPGGSTSVRVRHLPTTSGSKVAMLRLGTNDADQPVSDVMLVSVVVNAAGPPARPVEVELKQNHPNPFRGSTVIEYALTTPGRVEMAVYNVLGQRVSIIETAWRDAGAHRIVCDAAGMPSGVYVVELRHADAAGGFRVQRIRMLLSR